MTDRLTDEQVADCAKPDSNYLVGLLAREVQACRALRPDCPTCDGSGEQVVTQDGMGETIHAHITCRDCTDGKMPLDKWVALLVEDGERQAEVIAALSNSFATDPRDWGSSGARDAWRYGVVCGWREVDDDDRDVLDEIAKRFPLIDIERMERLYSAQAQHDALLKMVPKVAERRSEVTAEQVAP